MSNISNITPNLAFGNKAENGGITSAGKLTADEFNTLVERVNANTASIIAVDNKANEINDLNALTSTELDEAVRDLHTYTRGRAIFDDPTFKSSYCGVSSYLIGSSWSRGAVADTPNDSGNAIWMDSVAPTTRGCGGLVQPYPAAPNREIVHRIIAKVPVGYNIQCATNSLGTNPKTEWLTSTAGTGKWEEYVYRIRCGSTGNFSTPNGMGYIWFDGPVGTPQNPVRFYICFLQMYDMEGHAFQMYGALSKTMLFADMWNAICKPYGKFDSYTGKFTLNGLTLSFEEAQAIYAHAIWRFPYIQPLDRISVKVRTNIMVGTSLNYYDKRPNLSYAIRNDDIETLRISDDNTAYGCCPPDASSINNFVVSAQKLKAILGRLDLRMIPKESSNNITPFQSAPKLEEFYIQNLKTNIDLSSTQITTACLKFLIENSNNTNGPGSFYPITVSLKSSVLERINNEESEDSVYVVNNMRNITLIGK